MYYVLYTPVELGGIWRMARGAEEANRIILHIARPDQRKLLSGAKTPQQNIKALPAWRVRTIPKKLHKFFRDMAELPGIDVDKILDSGGIND